MTNKFFFYLPVAFNIFYFLKSLVSSWYILNKNNRCHIQLYKFNFILLNQNFQIEITPLVLNGFLKRIIETVTIKIMIVI